MSMIATYEDLSPEALEALGFDSSDHACRLLQEMAGHDVPDSLFNAALAALIPALAESADPDRAVANLVRWAESVGSRANAYQLLAASPQAAQILVTVLAASQFFADLLIHDPEYLEALTNPTLRAKPRDAVAYLTEMGRRVAIPKTPNARREALRRAKGPEVLRIGVRDLLGDADMPTVVREISDFADACVTLALQICREERSAAPLSFAVIAMGKLGGQELNYSSDIDLIFVHGDDENVGVCIKLAEAVRDTLARVTETGYLFRVDLRLRPEGRFGPVSRSLSSCRAYYESWAEPWERQALLKARCVAGDEALGQAFLQMTQAFVYRSRVEEAVVENIRQNKRRLEQKIARAGESDINVKEGIGGIRDIEFPIQLMQLLVGGSNPAVRTGNTLEALDRLTAMGALTEPERATMHESYRYLRTVEHRLQLLDDRAVRTLPREPRALRHFGRILGYADGDSFLRDYHTHTEHVHRLFERLFYHPRQATTEDGRDGNEAVSEWVLTPDDATAQKSLRMALTERGFADIAGALQNLRDAVTGSQYGDISPEARAGFAALVGPLLDAAAMTSAPDAALRGIDLLAQALPSRAVLYRTLSENTHLLPRLCRLAAKAPFLWQTLLTHLEFLDLLADEEVIDAPLSLLPLEQPTLSVLARTALRTRLHIGARDTWELSDITETLAQTTHAAETILAGALTRAQSQTEFTGRFGIVGMGKLGGAELNYSSDWDVLYVAAPDDLSAATRLAERLQHILRDELLPYGVRFDIDARLRPDGRKGALVLDPESYRRYYAEGAATWERQALLKARFVAGDATLGQEFATLVGNLVYQRPAADSEIEQIRAMKRRLELERSKGTHDLKLGPGGMTDIEWTAQLLQLRHGAKRKRLRTQGTLPALRALRDDALVTQADWQVLDETYRRLVILRNQRFLQTGVSSDVPTELSETLLSSMLSTREVSRRLFYGEQV